MTHILEVVTLLLVVLAATPGIAHVLELPGKRRLPQETYVAVQSIYYPGFTIAGIAEPVAIIATLALLLVIPRGGTVFWLTLLALLGLAAMHAAYWIFTHPVNKFWLQGQPLGSAGAGFFGLGRPRPDTQPPEWSALRDRWEYSHVLRAVLASLSLVALVIAVT